MESNSKGLSYMCLVNLGHIDLLCETHMIIVRLWGHAPRKILKNTLMVLDEIWGHVRIKLAISYDYVHT